MSKDFFNFNEAFRAKRNSLQRWQHGFHIVDFSPWPLTTSLAIFVFVVSLVSYFHVPAIGFWAVCSSIFLIVINLFFWWRDVIREAADGYHTLAVQFNLRLGVILFIVSEVMFFFGFFWAFFHSSLSPSIEIGGIWPPKGIVPFAFYQIPLLNTVILLSSGAAITFAHCGFFITPEMFKVLRTPLDFKVENFRWAIVQYGVGLTLFYGYLFTYFQYIEYDAASFSIADGIYGSTFYMLTGFHGLHVIVGTIFLLVAFIRNYYGHFTVQHHIGFEAAAWYWHFVDVVWLFLYIFVYCWGS